MQPSDPLSTSAPSGNSQNANSHSHLNRRRPVSILSSSFPDTIGPALPYKYRERRPIGRGSCSSIWSMVDNSTGLKVAGKLSDLTVLDVQSQNFARTEAENIVRCEHPNIIRLYESYERNGKILHILEYADAGDLLAQVEARANHCAPNNNNNNNNNSVPQPLYYRESEVLAIFSQLCLAIHYIHSRRIMHRDLKTPNALLTECGLIKLGDFGFSRQYEAGTSLSCDIGKTFCGTPYYVAPELWKHERYSYKADIWSLGVILYELMALRKPFPAENMADLMKKVLQPKSYPPIPHNLYSKELINLMERILDVNPATRPTIKQILFSEIMQKTALPFLKTNIMRPPKIPDDVKKRIVSDVEMIQEEYKQYLAEQENKKNNNNN